MINSNEKGEINNQKEVVINIQNLSKNYGEIKALKQLDLEIYAGETFGLLGSNGAGKTTTVRLLNGIIKPTDGTATILGNDIILDTKKVKIVTGMLAESPGLFEKLTPVEFLEFFGSLYNVKKDKLKKRVNKLLTLFDLLDRENYLIEGFSHGMKQKVLIAATLINNPPVIFLDEPTNGLDPRAASMVKNLIKDLSIDGKKTIVICSHILPLVEELCDRIGLIHQGKLIALGTLEEILEQAGTKTLEEAFIELTGGKVEHEMREWRET